MFHHMKYLRVNINFMTSNADRLSPLGKWIKAILDAKGKSQAWLAGEIHLKPPQVSRIMSGESEAPPRTLNAIADALGKKRIEVYRAAGHLEPITPKDDLDESLLFQANRLPEDERERWLRRIESDANDYQQRKAAKSTSKTRA